MLRLLAKKKLARKYAIAFLNTSENEHEILFNALDIIETFRASHGLFFKMLQHSNASMKLKHEGIAKIFAPHALPRHIVTFLQVLVSDKTIGLLSFIIKQIREEYKQRNNLIDVTVTSSHELQPEQKNDLEAAVKEKMNGTLSFTYVIDERLISGIKIRTHTYYWEESLAQRIRAIEHTLSS